MKIIHKKLKMMKNNLFLGVSMAWQIEPSWVIEEGVEVKPEVKVEERREEMKELYYVVLKTTHSFVVVTKEVDKLISKLPTELTQVILKRIEEKNMKLVDYKTIETSDGIIVYAKEPFVVFVERTEEGVIKIERYEATKIELTREELELLEKLLE